MYSLIFCGLFNGAVIISDNITSNVRMINEEWIVRDMEGSDRRLLRGSVPDLPGAIEDNHEKSG
jgi:hypothetical protein